MPQYAVKVTLIVAAADPGAAGNKVQGMVNAYKPEADISLETIDKVEHVKHRK